jgi:hypothetical protein
VIPPGVYQRPPPGKSAPVQPLPMYRRRTTTHANAQYAPQQQRYRHDEL